MPMAHAKGAMVLLQKNPTLPMSAITLRRLRPPVGGNGASCARGKSMQVVIYWLYIRKAMLAEVLRTGACNVKGCGEHGEANYRHTPRPR